MVPWERDTRIGRDGVSLSGSFQTSLPETDPQAVTAAGAAFSEVSRDSPLVLEADLTSQSAECQAHGELPEVGHCCLQLSIECLWVGCGPCSTPCCLPRTALHFGAQWSKRPGPGQLCLGHTVHMGKNRASLGFHFLSRESDAEGASRRPPQEDPVSPAASSELSIWLSWTEGPCPDSDWGCGRCSGRFPMPQQQYQNGESEESHAQFLKALQNAVTTFVNRMKSNHVRGRSITNDSAVLSLFQSINTMHPQLLELLNQLDERRRMCHAHPPRCPSRASGLPSGACHIH